MGLRKSTYSDCNENTFKPHSGGAQGPISLHKLRLFAGDLKRLNQFNTSIALHSDWLYSADGSTPFPPQNYSGSLKLGSQRLLVMGGWRWAGSPSVPGKRWSPIDQDILSAPRARPYPAELIFPGPFEADDPTRLSLRA